MVLKKCQIFTPKEYVVKLLDLIGYFGNEILNKNILENSCGEGNILIEIVDRYINEAMNIGLSNSQIKKGLENNILGFEIDTSILNKCILNLNKKAAEYSITGVQWNISSKDYLKTTMEQRFDYIVGNPPYIMYQDIEFEDRVYLKKFFSSCAHGKFDYCYPFIEKGYTELNKYSGKMIYLIPNSIFKNTFGQNLRDIMIQPLVSIHDYKITNVFKNAITSSAIILLDNNYKETYFNYYDTDFSKVVQLDKKKMINKKWFFSDLPVTLGKIKFSDHFDVGNSVATLLNKSFVIKNYELLKNTDLISVGSFKLERNILKPAGSPRALAKNIKELIIFPYYYKDKKLVKYTEDEFKIKYPYAYMYLEQFKEMLENRNSDKSASWFEYGRSQALSHLNQPKILVSSVMTNKVSAYKLDSNVIPYSGFYITVKNNSMLNLDTAKNILESSEFYEYLINHGINANGKSIRFSVNDIKNYTIDKHLI
ncbi:N-6 DNA methylase [Enterococcus faecalis]|nr:N-6 DNA methylase [Enterococcus faecalis]